MANVDVLQFDLQAAERAKDEMHAFRVNDREIDVHYSLPKESEMSGACDREKNQGTLLLRLKSGRNILSDLVRQTFSEFGTIKAIRNAGSPDRKMIEFFDSRGAALAFDRMRDVPFQESTLDIQFLWDEPPASKGGRGDRGRGRGGRRGDRDFQEPAGGVGGGGRYGDDRRSAQSPDRTYRGGPQAGYGPNAGNGPATSGAFSIDEARKVQDLLASLSGGGGVAASSAPVAAPYVPPGGPPPPVPAAQSYGPPSGSAPPPYRPPPSMGGMPPPSNYPPASAPPQGAYNPNFQPPPARYPPAPTAPTPAMPYAANSQQGGSGVAGSSILPPNVVAMLQSHTAAQPPSMLQNQNAPYGSYAPAGQPYAPSSTPYGPPPTQQAAAPPQSQSQGSEQTQAMTQLLALLVSGNRLRVRCQLRADADDIVNCLQVNQQQKK